MQTLSNGRVFLGWGGQPDFSEESPGGHQVFNGSFALGVTSYRAYRFPWTGSPLTRPAMAAAVSPGGGVRVWVSWNGATEVAWWRVLGGSAAGRLRPLKMSRVAGFETMITLSSRPRYLAVEALGSGRRVLGISRTRRHPA